MTDLGLFYSDSGSPAQVEENHVPIHKAIFKPNNKKQTKGRKAYVNDVMTVQSISMYSQAQKLPNGKWLYGGKLIGYRYIQHQR